MYRSLKGYFQWVYLLDNTYKECIINVASWWKYNLHTHEIINACLTKDKQWFFVKHVGPTYCQLSTSSKSPNFTTYYQRKGKSNQHSGVAWYVGRGAWRSHSRDVDGLHLIENERFFILIDGPTKYNKMKSCYSIKFVWPTNNMERRYHDKQP